MIDSGLLAESKSLVLEVAPDLAARPLYFIDMEELEGLPCTGGCYGWAMNNLFIERPIIDRLGDRYEGPGPIVALDGKLIADNCEPQNFANCIRQVALHEGAHLYPIREIWEPADTQRVRDIQLAKMAEGYSAPEPKAGAEYDPHDWRFIRRVCHLLFRSKLLGAIVPTLGMHKGHTAVSVIEFYLFELLAECVAMKGATMAAIEAQPAPAGFMDIWTRDLEYINWRQTNWGI